MENITKSSILKSFELITNIHSPRQTEEKIEKSVYFNKSISKPGIIFPGKQLPEIQTCANIPSTYLFLFLHALPQNKE